MALAFLLVANSQLCNSNALPPKISSTWSASLLCSINYTRQISFDNGEVDIHLQISRLETYSTFPQVPTSSPFSLLLSFLFPAPLDWPEVSSAVIQLWLARCRCLVCMLPWISRKVGCQKTCLVGNLGMISGSRRWVGGSGNGIGVLTGGRSSPQNGIGWDRT